MEQAMPVRYYWPSFADLYYDLYLVIKNKFGVGEDLMNFLL